MKKQRGLILGLGLAALMGLSAGEAHAGPLTVVLSWGSNTLVITSATPYATVLTTGGIESLTFNTTTLNAYLASNGSNLTFQAGSGVSDNQPSATQMSGATLTSTGQLNLTGTSAGGADSMTITAYLTDYTVPTGTSGVLSSSGSGNFTSTNVGNSNSTESWYNNDNSPGGTLLPSGVTSITSNNTTTNSGTVVPPSGTQSVPISPFVTPFSLTNQVVVTLTSTGKTGEADQYSVATLVTANGTVPEPASIVLMLTGMPLPLVVMGLLRRRRAAA